MIMLCLATLQFLCVIQATKYLYIAKKANYDDGRRLCQKHGRDLVKVTSAVEHQDLEDFYRNEESEVAWLGLHSNGEHYGYLDGTALHCEYWNTDEPDHTDIDHCVVLKNSVFRWNTRHCENEYPSLCGPSQPDEACKVKVFAHGRWNQDQEFTRDLTHVSPQASLPSCAKDCAILKCHYFSLDGKQCKVYNDNTDLSTQSKKGSTIWKRN